MPSTITTLGKNTFSRNNTIGGILGGENDKKQLTIHYNGSKADWDAISKNEDWDHGLKDNSVVICSDGKYVLDVSWGNYNWTWVSN